MDRVAVGDGGAGAGIGGFGPGCADADGLGSGRTGGSAGGRASLAVRQAAGQALTQIAEQPVVRTSLLASWALALSRWQGLLWLIPALFMLAAAGLWIYRRRRSLVPVA